MTRIFAAARPRRRQIQGVFWPVIGGLLIPAISAVGCGRSSQASTPHIQLTVPPDAATTSYVEVTGLADNDLDALAAVALERDGLRVVAAAEALAVHLQLVLEALDVEGLGVRVAGVEGDAELNLDTTDAHAVLTLKDAAGEHTLGSTER